MQNIIIPFSIGSDRNNIRILEDIDTTPAIDFSPESVSVSQIKSVIIAIPVIFNNKFICSLSILKTENIDKTLETKLEISSIIDAKIKKTVNIRIKKTYSGRYDFKITEKHR